MKLCNFDGIPQKAIDTYERNTILFSYTGAYCTHTTGQTNWDDRGTGNASHHKAEYLAGHKLTMGIKF